MLAVAVNAEAQVGGGAGVFCGAERRRVPAGEDRALRVQRRGAFSPVPVPPPAFAFPVLPLVFI